MQDHFFAGKRAVVTGAASGIGRALAAALAAQDCRVLLADFDEARATEAAAAIGGVVAAARCDVADLAQMQALAETAGSTMGGADLVFVNAGVGLSGPIIDADPAAFDWILGVNLRGAWNTAAVFARRWRDAGQPGALCFTASEHALGMQHAGMGLYTATKHAVLGLADVLRTELAPAVTVSVLCPGLTATDLHLAKRASSLPPDPPHVAAFAGEVMARGVPPESVAEAALRGVAAGEFLIVTHPSSREAAERRARSVAESFDRQAPWTEGAEAYAPSVVMAQVREAWRRRSGNT